jgi:choloylglycine hydrolase
MNKNLFSFQALVVAAALAFILFPGPASACTGMVMEGEDGTVVYGRTQEWSMFDFKTQATVYPQGKSFRAKTPEGRNGVSWNAKYGFLSFLLLDSVTGDGMNEKGLAAGSFYHEGFAEYAEYDPALAEKSMAPTNVVNYILSNFATIEEVRKGLQKVRVVPVKNPAIGKVPPVHFFVADPSGKSLVIEYRGGTPKIYDNPVGVITNNPTFDWHLQNLRNYGYLKAESYKPKNWGNLKISPLSGGSGLLGLPGDFTSPSRFVRALVLREVSNPTSGGQETVEHFFRVMDSFNAPSKLGEGQTKQDLKKNPLPSNTQYTVAYNTTDLTTYYHTTWNRQIRKIDLNEIDFTKSEVRKIPLDEKQEQNIKDVTKGLR